MPSINPVLWFDSQAEEAATFYVSTFKNSKILEVSRYGKAGPGPAGQAMVVVFELDGERFEALNGGPIFTFSEAISFRVDCADQAEVDYFWDALAVGGQTSQCGWLKDRYGLSWQVVPEALPRLLANPDPVKAKRAMEAMMKMTKLDIAVMEAAAEG
jgi:predicted 3-demethylubiquinone-9 3-methyltransferase (glyoxalase superfamily)